jgi:phage N-6-adenine-methyltransferase
VSEPRHNRGNSEQEVATPGELIMAVEGRFGPIAFDLAASQWCAWADEYFTAEHDALWQDWLSLRGVLWLNPEFGNLRPWAQKCLSSSGPGRTIIMLTPFTTANWAVEYVWGKAYVIGLSGRVRFVGHKQGYPKDLMLSVYGMGCVGFEVWDWRKEARREMWRRKERAWARRVLLAPGSGSTPDASTMKGGGPCAGPVKTGQAQRSL